MGCPCVRFSTLHDGLIDKGNESFWDYEKKKKKIELQKVFYGHN